MDVGYMSAGRGTAPKTGGWNLPTVLSPGTSEQLQTELLHETARFRGLDISGMDLSDSTFEECELDQLTAHDTQFRSTRWLRTAVSGMNAPVLRASRTVLREVSFEACRLGAAELYDATLDNVVFSNSKITWLNFGSSTVKDVLIRDCTIDELDLGQAKLERVLLENVRVGSVNFSGARMRQVDLRGAQLRSISGLESLRGTVITPEQLQALAELFAEHHGIAVRD